jgi:RimJ/RimL family protein N-acetyltransferase
MAPISDGWPLFHLVLRTERCELELRPMTEADSAELTAIKPDDAEPDPHLPVFGLGDPAAVRGAQLLQSYWTSMGNWRPEAWRVGFVVRRAGVCVGVQELESEAFLQRGTVETSSWLGTRWRGLGIGKEMRAAVLALAFEGLGAVVAETEALEGNDASLGVSASLGYQPNGETVHDHDGTRARMLRMRLPRATWAASVKPDWPCRVDGLDRALPMFGLGV